MVEDSGSSLPSTSGNLLTHRAEKMMDLCQVGDLMMKTLERGPGSPVCHKPTMLYSSHAPSPSEF